ncbi:MAG TPA: hypothetical protein PLL10_09805, partial [Elusimicrobiales bacterium]|nr:hypothetical protein [Elusimicrobiales bacterium]
MENNHKQVNLPPIGESQQAEEKKKPIAAVLFGKAGLSRVGWGAAVGQLMASKTALIAAALGVTALAGLATMTVSSKKAEVGGGSGEILAFSPYSKYTPGAAAGGDSALFPLPYAQGNQSYKDELYRASVAPDSAQSEPASEYAAQAAQTALPVADAAAGLRASGGAGGGGGGGGGGAGSVFSAGSKKADA